MPVWQGQLLDLWGAWQCVCVALRVPLEEFQIDSLIVKTRLKGVGGKGPDSWELGSQSRRRGRGKDWCPDSARRKKGVMEAA